METEKTNTIKYQESLPEEKKLELLKAAKSGSWYDGWKPYCIVMHNGRYVECSSPRMVEKPYGFRCPDCGNMIGWDLKRLRESPLNRFLGKIREDGITCIRYPYNDGPFKPSPIYEIYFSNTENLLTEIVRAAQEKLGAITVSHCNVGYKEDVGKIGYFNQLDDGKVELVDDLVKLR